MSDLPIYYQNNTNVESATGTVAGAHPAVSNDDSFDLFSDPNGPPSASIDVSPNKSQGSSSPLNVFTGYYAAS